MLCIRVRKGRIYSLRRIEKNYLTLNVAIVKILYSLTGNLVEVISPQRAKF